MTCIVALKTENGIWMACDSLTTKGGTKRCIPGSKMFERNGIHFAWAGSVRDMQVVKHRVNFPQFHPDMDPVEFAEAAIPDAIRDALKSHGAGTVEDGQDWGDSTILYVFKGEIYEMTANFGVLRIGDEYAACGSGEDYALGSLFATEGMDPKERVTKAVSAAIQFSSGCGGEVKAGFVPA